ncbi:Histone-binding protein rbbp7 [Globisporangium polare]
MPATTGPTGRLYGAVFDLDGTLLDTEGISERAIDAAVAVHGARHSKALHKAILGRPSAEWTRMVIDALSLHGAIEPLELAQQWERNMHAMMAEVQVLPGSLELLRALHARQVPMALATSSSSHAVEVKRQFHPELFSYFNVIVCGNDPQVARGKPEPDIFLLAAKRLHEQTSGGGSTAESSTPPPRCVVFEDSVLGVQAGKSAGMHTVAIPDPRIYEDASEREALYAHADAIITSLEHFGLAEHGW